MTDARRAARSDEDRAVRGRDVLAAIVDGCDGLLELRALPSRDRTFLALDDTAGLESFARDHAADDLYFGVATRRDATGGTLDHCQQLGALFVDLDGDTTKLDRFALPPSILIGSGSGQHAYWLLREPFDVPADADTIKSLLRRLAHAVGGDLAAAEPARILRIPATTNRKHDPPRPVTIMRCEPDRRYNPGDFDEWLPAEPAATTTAAPLSLADAIPPGARNATLYRLTRSLRWQRLPESAIRDAVQAVNRAQCQPPLDPAEVDHLVRHGLAQRDRAGHEPPTSIAIPTGGTVSTLPAPRTLRERLADPPRPVQWRIEGWQPANSRALLAAQFKSGKTSLVLNVVRSLADGDPFLGCARVVPITGVVTVIDTEMSAGQLDDWYRQHAIVHDDRVVPVTLRGRLHTFNVFDADVRAAWAEWLRAVQTEYLVLDCVRPILDTFGLHEHHEAGRFLVAFDALMQEAGIADALVVHHMGHDGERSRGDSRFRDWPDVELRLMRQNEDPAADRFLAAYGRDVDQPEAQLEYDAAARRLTLVGGSRASAKVDAALADIVAILHAKGAPLSGRQIKTELAESDHARKDVEAALVSGVRAYQLTVAAGPKGAKLYSVPVSRSVPLVSRDGTPQVSRALIGRDTGTHTSGQKTLSAPRDTQPASDTGAEDVAQRVAQIVNDMIGSGLVEPDAEFQLETADGRSVPIPVQASILPNGGEYAARGASTTRRTGGDK